jgi:hypothetical protein
MASHAALDEAVTAFGYFPLAQIRQPTQVLLVRTGTAPEGYARAPRSRGIVTGAGITRLLPGLGAGLRMTRIRLRSRVRE